MADITVDVSLTQINVEVTMEGAVAPTDATLTAKGVARTTVYNVRDYGALGNGSTDDTAAIQAALDAASNGGIVFMPVGQYLISAALRVRSNTTFDAGEATIMLKELSSTNMVQNYAVQQNRRVIDGVTNSTTSLTSATAAFVSGDIGKPIRVYKDDGSYLATTISSVTNATTVVLTAAPSWSSTGLYAAIGSRDKNITVKGGHWIRRVNNFTGQSNGWDSNSLRFRHVDGLEVYNIKFENYAGKYFVNAGDCHNFYIHDILDVYAVSDTVHINGPATWGRIERVVSYGSNDDIVSLTGGDFNLEMQHMADTVGSITDVSVSGIVTDVSPDSYGTARAVLLLAGQSASLNPFTVDRIRISDIRSQLNNYPVFIGIDTQDTFTQGGTFGSIVVDGGTNRAPGAAPGAFVRVNQVPVASLEVRSVTDIGSATDVWVETGSTVGRLVTFNVPSSRVSVSGTVTTKRIYDAMATLDQDETFTATKHFASNANGGSLTTNHMTVFPVYVGGSASIFLDNNNGQRWEFFGNNGGSFGVYDGTANKQPFTINPGSPSDAISINNGYNAMNQIFKPVQASTASAPAYVKGGIYFDTTMNKVRVGGATAWETATGRTIIPFGTGTTTSTTYDDAAYARFVIDKSAFANIKAIYFQSTLQQTAAGTFGVSVQLVDDGGTAVASSEVTASLPQWWTSILTSGDIKANIAAGATVYRAQYKVAAGGNGGAVTNAIIIDYYT
jgi:hypothetical protein